MHTRKQPSITFPFQLESPSGLSVQVNANGSIRRMDYRDIMLNLFLGTEMEGGPANIYLRRHGESIEAIPLLGPRSPAAIGVEQAVHDREGSGRGFASAFRWSWLRPPRPGSGMWRWRIPATQPRHWISSTPRIWRLPITARCG